jgi:hypothetical protein
MSRCRDRVGPAVCPLFGECAVAPAGHSSGSALWLPLATLRGVRCGSRSDGSVFKFQQHVSTLQGVRCGSRRPLSTSPCCCLLLKDVYEIVICHHVELALGSTSSKHKLETSHITTKTTNPFTFLLFTGNGKDCHLRDIS